MIEILAGDGIEYAFDELNISAKKTYQGKEDATSYYEVWELSEEDFKKLSTITEEEWQDDYGWYRYAEGSIMGPTNATFTINRREMLAWDGIRRLDLLDQWRGESESTKMIFYHSFKEYEYYFMPRKYRKLTEYLCDELGVSTERNVCALTVDLAKANNMTLAELFKIYEG